MTTSIRYLRLHLHTPAGRRAIGHLSRYGDVLRVSFDDDYIADPQRPTLSMSLRGASEADTQAILRAPRDERLVRADGQWPAFFDNLLPEGHNRERLARERGCSPDDVFELLAAAGHDLMGGVEVAPTARDQPVPDAVRHWHTALGLDVLEPGFVEDPVEDASALPGVIPKFSAVHDGRRYVLRRHGAAGDVILKLPTARHPSLVHNEATGYRLCAALRLDVAQARVIERADAELPDTLPQAPPFTHVLAVQRFDRAGPGGRRIHMEEFAQALALPARRKYGRDLMTDWGRMLALLARYSSRPGRDVGEFIARFVAFVLMGNTDAHLKNWALRYPDGHQPELAPVYDPVCVSALLRDVGPDDYGVNRAIDARLRAFGWDDLRQLIATARLLRPAWLLRQAQRVADAAQDQWPALLADAPDAVRESVMERLRGWGGVDALSVALAHSLSQ